MYLAFRINMNFVACIWILNIIITESNSLEFKYHPQNQTAVEGTTVVLTCVVEENVPDNSLYWIKTGSKLTRGKDILNSDALNEQRVLVDKTLLSGKYSYYKLEISNALFSDSGEYVCSVVDEYGIEVKSERAQLTVNQLPDPIYPICEQINNPVREGAQVNLKCEGEDINPHINLQLSKSRSDAKPQVLRNQWTTPVTKSFIANRADNNAVFICQLTTPADHSIIRNCSIGPLNVWYEPNVTIQHTVSTLAGREAIFICQSDANPPVTDFTWQFDPPLDIDRYDVDDIGQVMRIIRVKIGDNGLILTCTAKNTVDHVTYHVTMEVISKKQEDKPKTKAIESPNKGDLEKKSISLSVLLVVVSVLVLVIVFAIIVPVYYFCVCSNKEEPVIVAQPEVYFEPQDRMTLPLPNKRHSVLWRRSFGAQVPRDRDVDTMYLEIQSDHYIFTPDSRGNTLPY